MPLEIYMEGNIVFRQGDRTVYADRMFYDVKRQIGVILNGELIAAVPQIGNSQYAGLVRLRAAALRQLDNAHFVAQNGLVTTSRLEDPSYAFTSDEIQFEDLQQPIVDPLTGAPAIDPATGRPLAVHKRMAEALEQLRVRRRRARLLLAHDCNRPREPQLLHQQLPLPPRLDLRHPGAVRSRRLPTHSGSKPPTA